MFSFEILSGVSINLLSNVIQKKLGELKSNYDWKQLLVDTGNKVLIDDIQQKSDCMYCIWGVVVLYIQHNIQHKGEELKKT